ncbi:MAG: hypothetical protein R3246_12020 [Acidimicrobiia bacterium]|nr:hypothetical protein [Acidimicrobiia bacterium]
MRPAIATVVGPAWESALVAHARRTGTARLIGRCRDAESLDHLAPRAEVIYVGSDAAWLCDRDLRHLKSATKLVGVATDRPGEALLRRAGVDEVVEASMPPAGLLAIAIQQLATDDTRLIEVTGPRGAPGRSEVALALAWESKACLVEADHNAPSLGLRLALPPASARVVHEVNGLAVSTEPASSGGRRLCGEDLQNLLGMRRTTVIDAGPDSTWHRRVAVDQTVIVGEATDVGVVRLARLCERWMGPKPTLVINRHRPDQDLRPVLRATGLRPAAVIPVLPPVAAGQRPHAQMRAAVSTILDQRTAR